MHGTALDRRMAHPGGSGGGMLALQAEGSRFCSRIADAVLRLRLLCLLEWACSTGQVTTRACLFSCWPTVTDALLGVA